MRIDESKANSDPMASFSPIARALLKMDASTKERMTQKFYICYVMAKKALVLLSIQSSTIWNFDMTLTSELHTRMMSVLSLSLILLLKPIVKSLSIAYPSYIASAFSWIEPQMLSE